MPPAVRLDDGIFDDCEWLEEVVLPEGITELPDELFKSCYSLKRVHIPDSVIKIGMDAFKYCLELESIKLPFGLKVIGSGAFKDCRALREAALPPTVRIIGEQAFDSCVSLEDISIPQGAKIGAYAFAGCRFTERAAVLPKSKDSVAWCMSGWLMNSVKVADGVERIGKNAFCGCKNLEEVILPDSVKEVDTEAFALCKRLKRLVFPKEVVFRNGAFRGCEALDKKAVLGNCENIFCAGFGEDIPFVAAPNTEYVGCSRRQRDKLIIAFLMYYRQYPSEIFLKYLKHARIRRYALLPFIIESGNRLALSGAMDLGLIDLHKAFEYEELCEHLGDSRGAANIARYREESFPARKTADEIARREYARTHSDDPREERKLWDFREIGDEIILERRKGCATFVEIPAELNGKPVTTVMPPKRQRFAKFAETIRLPSSIRDISDTLFSRCPRLKRIEYAGTPEQWASVKVLYSDWLYRQPVACKFEIIEVCDGYIVVKAI